MSDLDLEDFESDGLDVAELLNEAESIEFRGVPIMLTDAAMVGAQSIGLSLFNLDEDKLLDSENVYAGQLKDAVVTIFCCLCESGEVPEDAPNQAKWAKILRSRSIGAAAMRPRMFEQTLVDFSNDFAITKDIGETFDVFNRLWSHVFQTDVELPGEGTGEGATPGKETSQVSDEPPSPAKSLGSTTTEPATASQPQLSTSP